MDDPVHNLNLQYDGPIPPHEYRAALYGRHVPEPGDDDADANEARARQELESARKCIRLRARYAAEEYSDARERVTERLLKEARAHIENAAGYRRIAASIRRRQRRAA